MRSFIPCACVRFAAVVAVVVTAGCAGEINNLPTTPTPDPVTETFTGQININGSSTTSFFTGATGAVVATLTSLGDNPPEKVGFSMGTMAGSTCSIVLRNDNAVVTSVIAGTVSTLSGSLCISVYDVGALTQTVPFTFTVTHP